MSFTTVVGFIAPLLSVAFIWPQVVRVFVKDSTEGLSPTSFLQGCTGSAMWTIYGIYKPNTQVAFANFSIVLAIVLILLVCVRHKKINWWLPVLVLSIVSIAGLVVANYSMTMMGWFTVAIGTPAIIPQVVRVYRTERLYGVSATTHGLLFACCITWFTYGALIDDWFVALPNLVGISGSFYIWMRALNSHRKYSAPVEAATN